MNDAIKSQDNARGLHTWRVSSVEAAVELAEQLKKAKEYDWFRGQRREWPPCSSIGRLSGTADWGKAHDRLVRFFAWLKHIPELQFIAHDINSALAIAQHYGIPTSLLDFTTDPGVAGFFAAEQAASGGNNDGCIYCLSTVDFRNFWGTMRKCMRQVRDCHNVALIRPRIPNLWRLEAQHGVFLYAPINWFELYPVDRILFPQSRVSTHPTAEDLLPSRKSQMEIVLDQYFMAESFVGFMDMVRSVFPKVEVVELHTPPDGYHRKFFTKGNLDRLSCWHPSKLNKWRKIPVESYRETVLGDISLKVDLRTSPESLRDQVAYGVRRALSLDATLRRKSVRWSVLPQKRIRASLAKALDWFWNGVRLLPYSNEDIAEGVGMCFALHRIGFDDLRKRRSDIPPTALLGEVVDVQFGSWEGSYARAYVSVARLRAAVRGDIKARLRPKYRRHARYIQPLLQACSAPERLFEFEKFAKLFVVQIAPMQVLRPEGEVAYFSPARLTAFGLP